MLPKSTPCRSAEGHGGQENDPHDTTQISLEEAQYRFLKREAARRECSLSSIVRELVEELMRGAEGAGPSILSIRGVFSDGQVAGHDHDRILYEALAERKPGKAPGPE